MRMYNPAHPGKVLKDYIAEFTVTEIAQRLGITRVTLSRIINEKAPITPDVAIRLGKLLETSSTFWLNMQAQYDVWQLEQHSHFDIRPLYPVKPQDEART